MSQIMFHGYRYIGGKTDTIFYLYTEATNRVRKKKREKDSNNKTLISKRKYSSYDRPNYTVVTCKPMISVP